MFFFWPFDRPFLGVFCTHSGSGHGTVTCQSVVTCHSRSCTRTSSCNRRDQCEEVAQCSPERRASPRGLQCTSRTRAHCRRSWPLRLGAAWCGWLEPSRCCSISWNEWTPCSRTRCARWSWEPCQFAPLRRDPVVQSPRTDLCGSCSWTRAECRCWALIVWALIVWALIVWALILGLGGKCWQDWGKVLVLVKKTSLKSLKVVCLGNADGNWIGLKAIQFFL